LLSLHALFSHQLRPLKSRAFVLVQDVSLGLLIGNTQADATLANYSYVLGGNALLQALRDLIEGFPVDIMLEGNATETSATQSAGQKKIGG
jgi:hypothetical protein